MVVILGFRYDGHYLFAGYTLIRQVNIGFAFVCKGVPLSQAD